MKLSKHSEHENELRLTLDARKRISLAKLLPDYEVCSFRAYTEGDKSSWNLWQKYQHENFGSIKIRKH